MEENRKSSLLMHQSFEVDASRKRRREEGYPTLRDFYLRGLVFLFQLIFMLTANTIGLKLPMIAFQFIHRILDSDSTLSVEFRGGTARL